jgi:hypothetical protein
VYSEAAKYRRRVGRSNREVVPGSASPLIQQEQQKGGRVRVQIGKNKSLAIPSTNPYTGIT